MLFSNIQKMLNCIKHHRTYKTAKVLISITCTSQEAFMQFNVYDATREFFNRYLIIAGYQPAKEVSIESKYNFRSSSSIDVFRRGRHALIHSIKLKGNEHSNRGIRWRSLSLTDRGDLMIMIHSSYPLNLVVNLRTRCSWRVIVLKVTVKGNLESSEESNWVTKRQWGFKF